MKKNARLMVILNPSSIVTQQIETYIASKIITFPYGLGEHLNINLILNGITTDNDNNIKIIITVVMQTTIQLAI